jgi:signal transduction histidine kinase
MNLALNAQAAMENGGRLRIRARTEGDQVVIEFADTGCGIPADAIDKIFDPFYSTKPNGTGLGLYVSHGIIEGHQGTIEVKSTVERGTTFTIRLPIHSEVI